MYFVCLQDAGMPVARKATAKAAQLPTATAQLLTTTAQLPTTTAQLPTTTAQLLPGWATTKAAQQPQTY